MTETAMATSERQIPAAECIPVDSSIPIVVDLDGTLLLTDTLHESFVAALFRSFGVGIVGMLKALRIRAAAKRFLSSRRDIDVAVLPTLRRSPRSDSGRA